MSFLYFDETIRESGNFILGALIVSTRDLTPIVSKEWKRLGLSIGIDEYKSSDLKAGNELGSAQRTVMSILLHECKLALTVAPVTDRRLLGEHCTRLIIQLIETEMISNDAHVLFVDQNIPVTAVDIQRLSECNVSTVPDSDSKRIAGLQVADHAAHALGGMLLEKMGVLTKQVRAGEQSGYDPDEMLALGFELWASLRHALIGRNEYIEGISPPPDDPANPYFRVDGVGLYLPPTCQEELAAHARARFGVNHLGCIH